MIRLLSKEDVKEEFRDHVSRLVRCPVLKRNHTALMCFACSRRATCEVAKEVGIADLDVDDVVYDSAFFKKATLSRKLELDTLIPDKRKKEKKEGQKTRKKADKSSQPTSAEKKVDISKDKVEHNSNSLSDEKGKVKGGNAMRGNKKKEILEYLKAHPNAKAGEIRKACGVSHVYATKVLQQVRQNQPQDTENPPQG
ncbi:hypothetical protein J7J18_06695 [bacterium]|nr:hypothetical protein [bacterium]